MNDKVPHSTQWAVYFYGTTAHHPSRSRPGDAIPIRRSFSWGEDTWHVPAIYPCTAGLVMDLCTEVDPERMYSFIQKWDLLNEDKHTYTLEEQDQIQSEHPLSHNFSAALTLNGRPLTHKSSSGFGWIPGLEAPDSTKQFLDHYQLNPERAWSFHRLRFLWATKRRPAIRTLSLTLSQAPVAIPVGRFASTAPGQNTKFRHPVTGKTHTLTVVDWKPQTLDLREAAQNSPNHCLVIGYTLTPPLAKEAFSLRDCAPDDADGPTCAIFTVPKGGIRAACSSLHFQPVEQVEWRMLVHEKTREDMIVTLL